MRSRPARATPAHRGAVTDLAAQDVDERLEVLLGPVAAGRARRHVGAHHPVGDSSISAAGSVISAQGEPRGRPGVRPVAYGGVSGRTDLQDQRCHLRRGPSTEFECQRRAARRPQWPAGCGSIDSTPGAG